MIVLVISRTEKIYVSSYYCYIRSTVIHTPGSILVQEIFAIVEQINKEGGTVLLVEQN